MSHSMSARDSLMARSAGRAAAAAAVSFASVAGRLLLVWPVQAGRLRLPAPPPRTPSLLAAPPPDSWSLSEGLPSASESAPNESPPRSYRSRVASSREQRNLMRLSASIMAFRASGTASAWAHKTPARRAWTCPASSASRRSASSPSSTSACSSLTCRAKRAAIARAVSPGDPSAGSRIAWLSAKRSGSGPVCCTEARQTSLRSLGGTNSSSRWSPTADARPSSPSRRRLA
mmetsp:Transcript_29896/g.97204  ORF Transcript_29896/g.97204 Transcript_29896/m.97204 type:complete len:231 (+) Transcript_29896:806-1498(+)